VFAIDGRAGRIAALAPFYVDLLDSTTGRPLWRSTTSDFTQQLGVGVDGVDGRIFVSDAGTANGKIGTPGGLTMLDEGGNLNALSVDAHSGHLVLSVDGLVQLVSVAIGSH